MIQMSLPISTIDSRMDAALEANVERLALAAKAEIHAAFVYARRSTGQTTRFARERIAKLTNENA